MIFARPTKAFFVFERAMMRPASWPPTRHDVPSLWERAKAMFADMLKAAGSARRLAQRYRFTRTARAEIESRLEPVEKIVRILLMVEAAIFLLMTPEGARMRRAAKVVAPPAPRATCIVMPRLAHHPRAAAAHRSARRRA